MHGYQMNRITGGRPASWEDPPDDPEEEPDEDDFDEPDADPGDYEDRDCDYWNRIT